ncbi:MAG TPA: NADH:ubiquinone oxidoreductase subunit N, partial [Rhodanobacteraceae bacterium]|nr:NADH:ubiquinone oxidoreductase subunit N [Rhodanobacteraceae bacterium]
MIEFHAYDLATILPELFLLGATCLILLIDLFIKPTQRDVTHWLTIAALAITGVLVWNRALPDGAALSAFNDMFVLDGMATILKIFILLVTLALCLYGRAYLRDRKLFVGEFYLLLLFA